MKAIKTISALLLILLCAWIYLAFVGGGNKLPISADEIIGKDKMEILQIAFEKSPVAYGSKDGILVGIVHANGSGETFNFKTIEEAKNKSKFMESKNWRICYKKAPFRANGLVNFWVVEFENGEAKDVRFDGYSEF